jgi:hypothetical protein
MLRDFFQSASAKGARSTALHALQWGLGLFLTGIPAAIWAGAPQWLLVFFAFALGAILITFLGSYIYLLMKDRDCLRSEHFSLSKMALERGLMGDDITGLIEEPDGKRPVTDAGLIETDEEAKS